MKFEEASKKPLGTKFKTKDKDGNYFQGYGYLTFEKNGLILGNASDGTKISMSADTELFFANWEIQENDKNWNLVNQKTLYNKMQTICGRTLKDIKECKKLLIEDTYNIPNPHPEMELSKREWFVKGMSYAENLCNLAIHKRFGKFK